MSSFVGPMFFSERLREYQESIAHLEPDYDSKLKEKELNEKYKDKMIEGCRIFVKELEKINDKKFFLSTGNYLKFHIPGAENSEYIYTGCPELKKFITQFNSINKDNQIKLNEDDKFINKITINEEDVKNEKLNYELSYELAYKTVFVKGFKKYGIIEVFHPPSKDNVFFG